MAMIKCPECGKEISEKAVTCPECSFPISKISCAFCGEGFSHIIYNETTKEYQCNVCKRRYVSIDDIINQNNGMPGAIYSKPKTSSVLTCPKCGSTAITTDARGANWTFGFIGASKTVNRCGSCGYIWKP